MEENVINQQELLPQESIGEETLNEKKDSDLEFEKYGEVFFQSMAKAGGVMATFFAVALSCGALYLVYLLVELIISGLFCICSNGYNKWFGDIDGLELGRSGMVYVYEKDAIMKRCPNRVVLGNIENVYFQDGDTVGVVKHYGKYDLLNLNKASYITSKDYDYMWRLDDDMCAAVDKDTMYTINYATGEILCAEEATGMYSNIIAICRDGIGDAYLYGAAADVNKEFVIAYIYILVIMARKACWIVNSRN